jgi:hypothetical protein
MSERLLPVNRFAAIRFLLLIAVASCAALNVNSAVKLAEDGLTNEDKSDIAKSILGQELKPLAGPMRGFYVDRYLSNENIEFFKLSGHLAEGFKLIEQGALKEKLKGDDFQCFVFREFAADGEKVAIRVSKIDAAFSCYGGYITSRQELLYEYRKVSGQWAGNLINRAPYQAL